MLPKQKTPPPSVELLLEILGHLEEAVAIIDQTSGLVVYVNRALTDLLGQSAAELLHHPLPISAEPGPVSAIEIQPRHFNRRAADQRRIIEVRSAFSSTSPGQKIVFFQDWTERQAMKQELRALTLKDELTHLYNKPTFIRFAEHQLELASRMGRQMVVLRIRLLCLPLIKERFGTKNVEAALLDLTGLLIKTFRKSDILARFDEDEFAVLAINSPGIYQSVITRRLTDNLLAFCSSEKRPYSLQISFATTWFDPEAPRTMEQLLAAIVIETGPRLE